MPCVNEHHLFSLLMHFIIVFMCCEPRACILLLSGWMWFLRVLTSLLSRLDCGNESSNLSDICADWTGAQPALRAQFDRFEVFWGWDYLKRIIPSRFQNKVSHQSRWGNQNQIKLHSSPKGNKKSFVMFFFCFFLNIHLWPIYKSLKASFPFHPYCLSVQADQTHLVPRAV